MTATAKKKNVKTSVSKDKKAKTTAKSIASKQVKTPAKASNSNKKAPVVKKTIKVVKETKSVKHVAKTAPVKKIAKVAEKPVKKAIIKTVESKEKIAEINKLQHGLKVKADEAKKAKREKEVAKIQLIHSEMAAIPEKPDFCAGDFVVYPAHGVGQVEGIDVQHVAGMEIALYTICFEKDRMRLKLPVSKAKASGLRKLSSKERLKDALATLQGRSQTRRIMWSRRAQEYETKINSGDPVSIAEVLRDLKKDDTQSEQSYSERQIYQAALERLAREVAAIEEIAEDKAVEKLEVVLSKIA